MKLHLTATLSIALVLAASATAQEDVLTPERIAELESVPSAAISPDGKHVAFLRIIPTDPLAEDDGSSATELHVLDMATGASRPYVTADSGTGGFGWTPDSSAITFLAKRDGDDHTSLYYLPVAGGEAQRAIAFDDRGIRQYSLSPDGTRVALVASEPESKERKAQKKQGFTQQVYEEEWTFAELYVAEPFGDEAPQNLGVAGNVNGLEWSPDGKHMALALAPTALTDDSYMATRVRVVDATSGAIVGGIENGGKLGQLAWRPDGSGLAVIAGIDQHDGTAARLLWGTVDATPAAPTDMQGERQRDEAHVEWLNNDTMLVLGSEGVWSNVDTYRFDGGRAVDRKSVLPLEGPVFSSISVSADGSTAALIGQTPKHPSELFTLDLNSGELTRRTNSNPWLDSMRLAKQEAIRYTARDGMVIEGILVQPLDATSPAPMIVLVHGGPEAHHSNGWLTGYSNPGQMAAPLGFATFYPNYRGSTGRGLAFLKTSQGDPAGSEFDDIVDGVDFLVENGIADKDKVGVTGGSYGGYATAWCSTYYSDRFAAGVMFVGISNKLSMFGTSDIPNELVMVHTLKRHWEDWNFFLERSPIYHADKAKTPLLIMHGTADPRVSPTQSREMYRNLKQRGQAPVRLVEYPGEGHGNRKAAARYDYSLRMLRWFDHYLMGDGGEPPAWQLEYEAVEASAEKGQ